MKGDIQQHTNLVFWRDESKQFWEMGNMGIGGILFPYTPYSHIPHIPHIPYFPHPQFNPKTYLCPT